MNKTDITPALLEKLLPLSGQEVASGLSSDHFVDDYDLLHGWYEGSLDEAEKKDIAAHLIGCPYCRTSVLTLRILKSHGKEQPRREIRSAYFRETLRRFLLPGVSVAAILLLLSVLFFHLLPFDGDLARQGDRLLLQRRGIPGDSAIACLASLEHYGFSRDGYAMMKAGELPIEPEEQEIREEYTRLLRRFPKNERLRLNYAQFLLEIGQGREALLLFDAVLTQNPNHFEALLGQGLARFERGDFDGALDSFLRANRLSSRQVLLLLNIAACHVQRDEQELAREYWIQAGEATNDPQLKKWIEERLQASDQNE